MTVLIRLKGYSISNANRITWSYVALIVNQFETPLSNLSGNDIDVNLAIATRGKLAAAFVRRPVSNKTSLGHSARRRDP